MKIPESEMKQRLIDFDKARDEGFFCTMFDPAMSQEETQTNKDMLLKSINPEMRLTESFFKRIYAYELTYPGFAEEAVKRLEDAGSTKSRGYYEQFSRKYRQQEEETLRNTGEWYVQQLKKQQEDTERKEVRKWVKKEQKKKKWKTIQELLNY